jgi:hypothetical protein
MIAVILRRVVGEAYLRVGVSLISFFRYRVFVLFVVCFSSSNKNYSKSLAVPFKKSQRRRDRSQRIEGT